MARFEGIYDGTTFLRDDLPGSAPLIESVLWERDHALLIGKEKSGKSIFFLQLLCHLTSGSAVFGVYEVPRPLSVAYCQGEGKLSDTQANLRRMRQAIDCEPSRFHILYYPAIALDTQEGLKTVTSALEQHTRPDVILIDPLYAFMQGDLIENADARRMVAHLRYLAEHFQATVVISHHAHRPLREAKTGRIMDEGDDSLFGSFIWKAYPDEVYLLEKTSPKVAMKDRRFSCDTQRMGKAIDLVNLELVDDQSLYYQVKVDRPGSTTKVLEVLRTHQEGALTVADLAQQSGYSTRSVWNCLSRLKTEGLIRQVSPIERPSQWVTVQPASEAPPPNLAH